MVVLKDNNQGIFIQEMKYKHTRVINDKIAKPKMKILKIGDIKNLIILDKRNIVVSSKLNSGKSVKRVVSINPALLSMTVAKSTGTIPSTHHTSDLNPDSIKLPHAAKIEHTVNKIHLDLNSYNEMIMKQCNLNVQRNNDNQKKSTTVSKEEIKTCSNLFNDENVPPRIFPQESNTTKVDKCTNISEEEKLLLGYFATVAPEHGYENCSSHLPEDLKNIKLSSEMDLVVKTLGIEIFLDIYNL